MTLSLFFFVLVILLICSILVASMESDEGFGFFATAFMLWLILGGIGTCALESPTYIPDYNKVPVEQIVERPDKSFSLFLKDTVDPIHFSSFKYDPLRKTKFIIKKSNVRNAWGGGLVSDYPLIDETLECFGRGSVTIDDVVITYE